MHPNWEIHEAFDRAATGSSGAGLDLCGAFQTMTKLPQAALQDGKILLFSIADRARTPRLELLEIWDRLAPDRQATLLEAARVLDKAVAQPGSVL
jgi:hypothetical protein